MAGSPDWKVYDSNGTYQASCKEPELAGLCMSFYGEGSTIRYNHKLIVWTEGQEECAGHESYDTVAQMCYARRDAEAEKKRAANQAYLVRRLGELGMGGTK